MLWTGLISFFTWVGNDDAERGNFMRILWAGHRLMQLGKSHAYRFSLYVDGELARRLPGEIWPLACAKLDRIPSVQTQFRPTRPICHSLLTYIESLPWFLLFVYGTLEPNNSRKRGVRRKSATSGYSFNCTRTEWARAGAKLA